MTAPHAGQRRRRKQTVKEAEVPRRHRRAWKEAGQIHEHKMAGIELEALAANPRPITVKPRREPVPIKERERPRTSHPLVENPKGELAEFFGWLGAWGLHLLLWWPKYLWRLTCSVGRGLVRVKDETRDYYDMPDKRWAIEVKKREGQQEQVREMGALYDKLHKKRVRVVLVTWLVGAPVALLVALAIAGPRLLALGVVAWLGWLGRHRGDRETVTGSTSSTIAAPPENRPSADIVYQALHHATFPDCEIEEPPHREGPGWETIGVLPRGPKSFRDVAAKLDALAGNLGVDADRLDLTPVKGEHGSARHLRIWWSKQDTLKGEPPAHPLLAQSALPADLWEQGIPLGIDRRGRIQYAPITDTPWWLVVGGPGSGKTWTLFGIAAAVAADPLWDVDAWTFKASGSFAPIKDLCGTYDYGADSDAYTRFHKYLRGLREEAAASYQALDDLPIARNPNDKVERAEAARPGSPHRPKIVFVDEFLSAIDGDKRILPELKELGRTLRALNIVFVMSGQYADRKTLEELHRLFGVRVCLRTGQHDDTETVLGGFHVPGLTEAHKIPLSAQGIGFIGGANPDPELGEMPATRTKMFGISRAALAEHVERCIEMRQSLRPPPPPAVDFDKADDEGDSADEATLSRRRLRRAWHLDEERMQITDLADILEVKPADVRALAKSAGVPVRKERGPSWDGTEYSIRRDDLS